MANDVEGLTAELEKAKLGSRELDLKIARAIGLDAKCVLDNDAPVSAIESGIGYLARIPGARAYKPLKRYTTSIDAALTLVPEGWTAHLMWQSLAPGERALNMADCWMTKHGHLHDVSKYDVRDVQGASPAIALCIAALRARQSSEERVS